MHGFGRADAYQDAQHLHAACPLRQRWVEAVSTLFNGRKVKGRGVGNRLKEVRIFQIIIGPGNGCVLVHRQSWNRLRKDMVDQDPGYAHRRGSGSTSWYPVLTGSGW